VRPEYNTIAYDGVAANISAAAFTNVPLNLDAIAEVNVLLGNYQAEYGRNSGAVINVATKSGTSQFRGSAYLYKRDESFNANNFFNNELGVPRPVYRYTDIGYNLGGPIFWPGKFNKDRNKLFFFFSGEYWPISQPGGTRYSAAKAQIRRRELCSPSPISVKSCPALEKWLTARCRQVIPPIPADSRTCRPSRRRPASALPTIRSVTAKRLFGASSITAAR
jgi:hypothetical protein